MQPVIEVVLINWRRPANIYKIVRALKDQTVPCTITVCDCHDRPEFALSNDAMSLIDRRFRWERNLGPFSRYAPLASYDHPYTFFIDDDILPGAKCLETFLKAAIDKPDFGVLGQMGRTLDSDGTYNILPIKRTDPSDFVEVDFIIRAYFVKTRYLHNLVKFRWQIGYFDEVRLQDDLLMCASIKYYDNLSSFLIPTSTDIEGLVNKEELNAEHAFSSNAEHFKNRQDFVDRIMYHGWRSINNLTIHPKLQDNGNDVSTSSPSVSVFLTAPNESTFLTATLDQLYHWDCCLEIFVVNKVSANKRVGELYRDPEGKIKYISGQDKDVADLMEKCSNEVNGSHVLILDAYEYYTKADLLILKEDIINHPEVDLFKFNFSHDATKRGYLYLWQGCSLHIIGGYWDIPKYRIYKWTAGTNFSSEETTNASVRPNGRIVNYPSVLTKTFETRAKCINMRFANPVSKETTTDIFFGDIEDNDNNNKLLSKDTNLNAEYLEAYGNWSSRMPLITDNRIFNLEKQLSETLSLEMKNFRL